ncbi:MAG: polyprenyl synthetase family protein [Succinivibrio sp.]
MFDIDTQIKADLNEVENILSSLLTGSEFEANVNNMCQHVVKAGGKRIRPILCILAWHALNSQDDKHNFDRLLKYAAATELLHTASLVHDDVIDKATVRRGKKTLNDTEGNHAAVLAGDYLFTRCFVCLHDIDNSRVFSIVNNTLASLVTGEINQMHNQGNLDISVADYENTIYCKTGALFEMATSGVAIMNEEPDEVVSALKEYGKQLGIAFQVADDLLDYVSSSEILGKTVGEDLEDGRITLPLIFARQNCSDEEKALLDKAVNECDLDKVTEFIRSKNSVALSREYAMAAVHKAKDALLILPDTPYRQKLCDLALMALNRSK